MATEILMPRLGWSMQEGVFGGWLKQDGEAVRAGDLIFTVESDKATQEVEAFDNGVLYIPQDAPQSGDTLPVGARLAYILQPGEPIPPSHQPTTTSTAIAEPDPTGAPSHVTSQPKIQNLNPKIAISPRARRVATELAVDWTQLAGTGATGRIVERDIRAAAKNNQGANIRATPVAQRMAREAGIDLPTLSAQKAGDKIGRADVEAAIAAREAARSKGAEPQKTATRGETVPVTRIRQLIAQRMVSSTHTTASVTLTTETDAAALVALREEIKAASLPRNLPTPGYNDLLIKLVGAALQEHPLLNATWTDHEILVHKEIHIGLAMETTEGLVVPVIRHVTTKSIRQISTELSRFIAKAQSRQLSPDELQDGTFTITNLGMYNIDAFTPIINLPQCAILGVGRIVKRPAVVGDQVVPRHRVTLSLTFDHRVVDGAPAARFLNTIREYIEAPVLWLVG